MREFPGKVITITKYSNKSTRPIQDTYGWTRYPTEDEQEVVDLWEEDFSEANNEDGHDLNLYKSVLEEDIGLTAYSKDNGVNRGTKKVILKQENKNNNSKQDNEKNGGDVENEQEESDAVTLGDDVDLPSFASGTSGYNNIDYLLYSVTCIGGIYVKDGVLSITYASEDKQLLCDHDEWIELLHIEHGIIMLTDSIIQQIARNKNGQVQSGLIEDWQDLSAKYLTRRQTIIPRIEDEIKNKLSTISTEEDDQDLTMLEVIIAVNNHLNSKIKDKKDLSKILGQSYKENGKRERQIMQRLLDGKGYRINEKKDDREEEDDQTIKSLLDTNIRQPTPFPIQGKEMYPNLDGIEESEHGKNVSLSTLKMDEIYVMGGATMGKDPSEMKSHNIELNLSCAEDIDKVASMAINALKHGSKGKNDGSKKISDKEMERIIRRIKEKLIIEKMEDEINEDESQKNDTKKSNGKDYKSKRTKNEKKLKEGGKGDDSGDSSSSDEENDNPGNKDTPLKNGKNKTKDKSNKGEKKIEGKILQEKKAKIVLKKEMSQMKMERKMILEIRKTQRDQKQWIRNQKLIKQS